jgi:hypothetical protein
MIHQIFVKVFPIGYERIKIIKTQNSRGLEKEIDSINARLLLAHLDLFQPFFPFEVFTHVCDKQN